LNTPDIFRAIIADEFHLPIIDNAVSIREEQADAKCRWAEIKFKNSVNSFCFSFDNHPRISGQLDPIFPYFNSSNETKGLCAKSDAIIICQKNSDIYIFLIEMKSSEKTKSEQQIKASKIMVNFIIDRLNNSKSKDKINKKNLNFRCISFYCPRSGYEGTSEKRNKIEFLHQHGLLIAKTPCHRTYHLTQFLP